MLVQSGGADVEALGMSSEPGPGQRYEQSSVVPCGFDGQRFVPA